MNIIKAPIESVIPWDKNPRGIKTKDYERLKKQILKLGVYKPLIAFEDKGKYVVLGGNMRIRALKEMGLKEVDISVVAPKTEAEKIEFALSDNDRVGFYEEDKLAELIYPHIKDIELGDFKVDLGEALDLKQIVERYGPDIDDGADEVPEIDDTPAVTKLGDLFTLGKHRLLCGDSTKAEDVARLMRGEKADMVFTDPPYGVDIGEKNRFLNSFQRAGRNLKDIANDTPNGGELYNTLLSAFTNCRESMSDSASFYVTAPQGGDLGLMMMMMQESGLPARHVLNWIKNTATFSMGRLDYEYQHEPILYGWKKTHTFYGNGTKTSVWNFDKPRSSKLHPTMKPVELVENAIKNSSKNGDIILDLFLGSGTTLVAAEKLNRVCYGMEIDPKYCDVIIKRYADYVGGEEDSIRKTREQANG